MMTHWLKLDPFENKVNRFNQVVDVSLDQKIKTLYQVINYVSNKYIVNSKELVLRHAINLINLKLLIHLLS